MKQFMVLLAACVCPHVFLSAVSADESRLAAESQPIAVTVEEIVQQKVETTTSADADDVAVESEVSVTTAFNAVEVTVEENVGEAAVEGADSTPLAASDEEVRAVPSQKRFVIRLDGNSDQNSALATIVDDSQAKVQTKEKIVVIGPDGKRQEFAISGDKAGKIFKIVTEEETIGNTDEQPSQIDSIVRILKLQDVTGTGSDGEPVSESRLAIGVQCEDVPEAVRSHLELGEKGIMIGCVREESPASDAALMKFDIIVQIGDTDVTTTDDVVSSVTASDGKELSLSIIRHGQPMKVMVTPRKMTFPLLLAPAQTELILHDLNSQGGNNHVQSPAWESIPESVRKKLKGPIGVQSSPRKFHPGVVIEQRMPSNEKDMQGLIEQVRKRAEDSGRVAQIRNLKAVLADTESGTPNKMTEQIEALQGQVYAMEQKLEQLEKRLTAEREDRK